VAACSGTRRHGSPARAACWPATSTDPGAHRCLDGEATPARPGWPPGQEVGVATTGRTGREAGARRRVGHAARRGTGVRIDSWNLPLEHPDGGFLGDRASQTAFRSLLDQARRTHSTCARDPFGRTPTDELDKRSIDLVLVGGDP